MITEDVKKVYNTGEYKYKMPIYGSECAAGLDISSLLDYDVLPRSRVLVKTGLSICWDGIDKGEYYVRVAPRSGLSVKSNIDIGAGVIDCDYRGEVMVCFINNGDEVYRINAGDRVAQLILTKIKRFSEIV